MPTVLRVGRFRFFFFSNEGKEPSHIHCRAGSSEAKFWLQPIGLASNYGFDAKTLGRIEAIVQAHEQLFIKAWNEYFA